MFLGRGTNGEMKLGDNLDGFVDKTGDLIQFFDNKYQETFCMNSNVIYIIDEAQSGKYFHRKFYNVGIFLFFQMHRHLGRDIYLITQDAQVPGQRVTRACRVQY